MLRAKPTAGKKFSSSAASFVLEQTTAKKGFFAKLRQLH
jgi:hypothetical protein